MKQIEIKFPESAVNIMQFWVVPDTLDQDDNLFAISLGGNAPGESVKYPLDVGKDNYIIPVQGKSEGIVYLYYKFPGGKIERTKVTVSGSI